VVVDLDFGADEGARRDSQGGPRPGQIAATKHEDLLMQTSMYNAGSGTPAYLRVVCSNAKADKPETLPQRSEASGATFEEQLKKGAATSYASTNST